MPGIYLICFFGIPFLILFPLQLAPAKKVLLDKGDSDILRGIAACLIILAHLLTPIGRELSGIGTVLNAYAVTGGMGVLLFFFASGYGIYKGYGKKDFTMRFWYMRIFNMYLPSVIIQFVSSLVMQSKDNRFNLQGILVKSFFGAWFVDVIMIQYFIFFLAWKYAKGRQNVLVVLSFLGSIMEAVFFIFRGFESRWYNGLLLFPIGMLIAYQEEKLIGYLKKKWLLCLSGSGIAFFLLGGIFAYGKEVYVGIDICKILAGTCLCLLICTLFIRIRFCSKVMAYIGKRSLFYYLVHLNLIEILKSAGLSNIKIFYAVFILTPCIVEIFYRPYLLYFRKQ